MRLSTVRLVVMLALVILTTPYLAVAQPVGQVRRIGMLRGGVTTTDSERNLEAFRQGLHDFGWVEGQNLTIAYRAAEGQVERLPALVINLQTAKAMGLMLSPTLLFQADEVIQ